MSVFTLALISISFYLFVIFSLYKFALISKQIAIAIGNKKLGPNKYNIFFIVLGALICMLYDLYVTKTSINMGGDRTNYLYEFHNSRGILTLGFQKFMEFFQRFSNDFNLFLLLICLICVTLTLIAYRIDSNSTPIVIFLIFSSQYLFSIFVNLKQCLANAFAALFFATLFSQKGVKREILCIITIIVACLFHESAIILVPIYLICRGKEKKHIKIWIALFFIAMIALDKIAILCANILSPFLPSIASKISLYFANISESDSGAITLLKGIPYYTILWIALRQRDKLIHKINNYDEYILITMCMVFLQIGSLWSYWLPRAQYFLYFPVFSLFGQIVLNTDKVKSKRYIKLLVCGSVLFFSLRDLVIMYLRYGGF